ncbi:MAG: cobalamin-dependent protein, partial [Rectinema sp.]|nr:cobalamin-dependent protein [Rectinema sp.]
MMQDVIFLRHLLQSPMLLAIPALRQIESRMPETTLKWNQRQRLLALEDLVHHTRFIGTAALYGDQALLSDYIDWLKVLWNTLGFRIESLRISFQFLEQAAHGVLSESDLALFLSFSKFAKDALDVDVPEANPYLKEPDVSSLYVRQYLEALLGSKRQYAVELVQSLVANGKSLINLYEELFIPAQRELGYLWHQGRISVVREHYVTAATQAIISGLYGRLFESAETDRPLMYAACAEGELHEIGIRYIADYFQHAGWNTRYYGANVPAEDLLREIRAQRPSVIALSATLAVHLPEMESLIARIREEKYYQPVILAGGHALEASPDLW